MRPKGFKNPHKKSSSEDFGLGEQVVYGWEHPVFESGADEYERCLREEGVFTYGHHTPEIELSDAKEVSGYWVFIEEE